ncbi:MULTISPECIES: MarR family transcriptional regulator [Streptomyces]|uniref:MarR family transcriptional regulator n=1 Tax=Streptomyces TaxID=1883 RepID=UPI00163C3330|nr:MULTISPECIES: MarR family transcriptional regulator [Streptomyces]MBC2875854.1 MarR family transcriptional regulator [Streptomyces sp. TYQ1024]UBI37702.1 MarR family transcriptional regulator [Streptomyces mobaraensis]UKW30288.1 MarR family transcriptional regulator [Streptomyces sp. TYQ1024]
MPTPAYPMAKPGFGKREAPDQRPRSRADFAHLPAREESIAAFVDRLPEGAAMDAKTLAKLLPNYGQAACRTALRNLVAAGHLISKRMQVIGEHGSRWVTCTFFSRTPRPREWWESVAEGMLPDGGAWEAVHHLGVLQEPVRDAESVGGAEPVGDLGPVGEARPVGDGEPVGGDPDLVRDEPHPVRDDPAPVHHLHPPSHAPDPPLPPLAPHPPQASSPSRPSPAYRALALLGSRDPRLTLSAADCSALEPLAAEWLARQVNREQLLAALSNGLPPQIHNPAALVRKRLESKMPPIPYRPSLPPPSPPPLLPPPQPEGADEIVARSHVACAVCHGTDAATRDGAGVCATCAVPEEPEPLPGDFDELMAHVRRGVAHGRAGFRSRWEYKSRPARAAGRRRPGRGPVETEEATTE